MAKPRSKARTLKQKDLAAATKASVTAALTKNSTLTKTPPGTLTGFWISEDELGKLSVTPEQLAAEVAKGVKATSGISVKPKVMRVPGGVLTGFLPPGLRK